MTGGEQDVLDLSHLNTINLGAAFNQALFGTEGFDPTANGKNVSDFVQLVNDANGKDVHVQVDADGTGAAHSFQDVVVLHNYQAHGNTVDIMFANAHQAILHVAQAVFVAQTRSGFKPDISGLTSANQQQCGSGR